MRVWASVALAAAVVVAAVSAQSTTTSKFDVIQCYKQDITYWMPNTLHNLIALIEKFESKNTYSTNMDELAEMLLLRYRRDGIVYRPGTGASDWTMDETTKANKKQALIELISRPTTQLPVDTFDLREECALHRMLSHSTDDYPIAGIDDIWNTNLVPASSGRVKRSTGSVRAASQYEAAVHPVERGVIETPYGPVAGGTLLAGLMSISNNPSYTIQSVLGSDSDYMPSEMKSRTLIPVYAATLAGDLGELALWTRHSTVVGGPTVGPLGRFHNCTTCSKQFSLKSNAVSFLSRAEIFAGLDALILTAAYSKSGASGSNSLKLSQLLNLYYSEKGLPGMPDYKACNRLNLYQSLPEKSQLTEQALNFMYAYTKDFADQKYYIEQNVNNYLTIQQAFTTTLTQAVQAMESFIGSYNYDDEGASRCYFSSGGNSWAPAATTAVPPSEGSADLVAVYAEEGTTQYMEKERQMIADVARRLGVSTRRSRLGVLRAKDATWIQPLQNISNIADWGCNFTIGTLYQSGSSGSRGDIFTVVLGELTNFYDQQNRLAFADLATSSGRSQVVVWQVPAAMPGDLETNKAAIKAFRLRFPDVSIIFVGRNEGPYAELLDDSDDFISYSNKNLKTLTDETVNRILMSPRFFVYPSCDPNNSTIPNYIEASHIYDGAVTPNVTTYIRIPPQTYHYSEELTLQVQGKVRACFSRTNRLALEGFTVQNLNTERDKLPDDQVQCTGGPNDALDKVTYKWLCDRYIQTCNPVYVSVTGLDTAGARVSCNSDTDPECDFPNQIQYTLTHKGMICGASCTVPALLLLLLPALLQYFLH